MRSKGSRVAAICGACAFTVTAELAADWREAEPFRQDVIEGRQFDYNAESFLHRFTFEPAPALERRGGPVRDGVFGTGGSTRSDELYTRQDIQLTAGTDGPMYFRYRYRRFEDFDGRYDRNLLGVGAHLSGQWRATLYGDIKGAKESVDLQTELAWADSDGNRFRAALVAPDVAFDSKQDDAVFERQPYTYYLEGARRAGKSTVYGFVNYNGYLRLRDTEREFTYRYEQAHAGLGVDVALTDGLDGSVEVEGLYTTRRLDNRGGEFDDSRLRRRHNQLTAELRHAYRTDLDLWGGIRYFRLSERDRRPADDDRVDRRERIERMVYTGVTWHLSDTLRFAPGVFVNQADIRKRENGEDDDEEGVYGKLTLPLQITVDRSTGGYVTLNLAVRLHRAAFGGGNIQVYLPF